VDRGADWFCHLVLSQISDCRIGLSDLDRASELFSSVVLQTFVMEPDNQVILDCKKRCGAGWLEGVCDSPVDLSLILLSDEICLKDDLIRDHELESERSP